MGKGGANMGKLLKGATRESNSEKDKNEPQPISSSNYDKVKAMWDHQNNRLMEMIDREEKNSRINQRLVTTLMRNRMREDKMSDLNDEVAVLAQEHQREMDRKDAVVQTMMGRLSEVEDQFLVVQRSHAHKLGILNTIHHTKIRQLEAEFERDLKTVKGEFDTERDHLNQYHERMKNEIKAVIAAVDKKNKENIDATKTSHETIREEIKNNNLESINELRINLERKIDDLEKQFDEAHAAYVEKTKDKNKEFKTLQESDRKYTQENKMKKRKINKLQKSLSYMKNEIEMNRKECESRNKALREQRDIIAKHCRDLKGRMLKLREQEKRRLVELTVRSRKAQTRNEKNVSTAERILKLMEAARKLETEREKVLPFYDSMSIGEAGKESATKEGEAFLEDMKSAGLKAVETKKAAIQWNSLENFHKKYNKVLLDKLAIEQERMRLERENGDLRSILQQYLDGIAVTEDAVDNNNSLLIINGRTNVRPQAKVRRVGPTPQIEANQVMAGYARQARRT